MCSHGNMTGFKYCPYCGKKITSQTKENLERLRRAEKVDEKQHDYGFCLFHNAIWSLAEDVYCHDISQIINIDNCPDDAAQKVFEIAEKIREEITPIYNKYKLMILKDIDSSDRDFISKRYTCHW